jgi:hypothetical protein
MSTFRTGTQVLTNTLNTLSIYGNPVSGTANRLEACEDVVESNKANGTILVYNSALNKYVLSTDDIDGGSF